MPGTLLIGIDVEKANDESRGFIKFGSEFFNQHEIPVTWYVTGKTLEKCRGDFLGLDTGIERSGFIDIQGHTYGHILLKTVLLKVPEGRKVHGLSDWYYKEASSIEEIDADLEKCQQIFEDVLGRRAIAMTAPWTYYRGLGDRPDILEIVEQHGFRILRTFGRDANDCNPVPLEWQPFFYKVQGFPDTLELMVHGYLDDFYWEMLEKPVSGGTYLDYLKGIADETSRKNLVWSLCSHDHGCDTQQGFENKAGWLREIIEYAKSLGIRFINATNFYNEKIRTRKKQEKINVHNG